MAYTICVKYTTCENNKYDFQEVTLPLQWKDERNAMRQRESIINHHKSYRKKEAVEHIIDQPWFSSEFQSEMVWPLFVVLEMDSGRKEIVHAVWNGMNIELEAVQIVELPRD